MFQEVEVWEKNEIRGVYTHQREEEGVWKPEAKQKTKFWINMGEYLKLVKSNNERTNTNLGTP